MSSLRKRFCLFSYNVIKPEVHLIESENFFIDSSIYWGVLLVSVPIVHLIFIITSRTANNGFSYPTSTEQVSKTIVWLLWASKGEEIVNLLLASLWLNIYLFNIYTNFCFSIADIIIALPLGSHAKC
jgi:hypothetical protein